MKTSSFLTALVLSVSALTVVHAVTYRSPDELFLTADVDGDGRDDAIIIDRSSGAYRVGYQLTAGVYTWSDSRPTGIQGATSAGFGHILSLNGNALVVASDVGNEVNIINCSDPSAEVTPVTVFPDGIGSGIVVSANFALPPVTPFDDLVIATGESIGGGAGESYFASLGSGTFNFLTQLTGPAWVSAERIQLGTGLPSYIGVVARNGSSNAFFVESVGPISISSVAGDAQPVPPEFTYGLFGAGTLNQFLFHASGGSNIVVRAAQQPSPGVFQFTAPVSYPLGLALEEVYVIPGTPSRILVVGSQGAEARVYDYDGVHPPVLLQTLAAFTNETWTGSLPIGGGNFQMLSGAVGGHGSTTTRTFKFSGGHYFASAPSSLPAVHGLTVNANVFLFQTEPFVNANPGLIGRLNAADWSSHPNFSGGQVFVTSEQDRGTSLGLGNPTVRNLGTLPSGANFGLVNQYHPSISLVSLDAVSTKPTASVTISPTPGPQTRAVQVTLNVGDPSYQAAYSLDGATWSAYNGPFWLFKTTHVRYLAVGPGGFTKTPIKGALYTFAVPPSAADSDGDGVPDYVELAYGLDPTKGPDTDGDGFSDLNEILAGKNPGATNSVPSTNQLIVSFQSFDFQVAPRPFDPIAHAETGSDIGVEVAVYELSGSLLRTGLTTNIPVAPFNPAAPITNILAERLPPLVALSLPYNYSIATAASDPVIGREMLGLVRTPHLSRPAVPYAYGGGNLSTEAANWVATAQAVYSGVKQPTVTERLGVFETIAALLVERKVNEILVDRGVPGFNATNLTLFPFRVGDIARQPMAIEDLQALSSELDPSHPGFDLANLADTVLSNVVGTVAMEPLRRVTVDVYRTSSLSNNAAPGRYSLPVEVLRQFLITGQLQSNYAKVSLMSVADRGIAFSAATSLLAGLSGRPVVKLDLTVESDSFQPTVTRLLNPLTGHYKNLFIKEGVPYQFPQSFTLVPGAVVHVVAYGDFIEPDVAGESLQVIDATLVSSPDVPNVATGNGLTPDAWGLFFFGGPFDLYGDADGDGISNLQEFLDGTDPKDGTSHGLKAFSLLPPQLSVKGVDTIGGKFTINFGFPTAYASAFHFYLEKSLVLGGTFTSLAIDPVSTGLDQWEIVLPAVQDAAGFYRVNMLLK